MKDAMARCARCERPKGEHRLVNFADGPMIGAPALVCPTAVFLDSYETREDHTHTDRALFDALEAAKGDRREPLRQCDCIASGNAKKPKQHGADPHAKNCAIYREAYHWESGPAERTDYFARRFKRLESPRSTDAVDPPAASPGTPPTRD
jgi:hypothetical protein